MDASVAEVERELQRHEFRHVEPPGLFSYESIHLDCTGYEWVAEYGLQDEYDELLRATDGLVPTVHVSANVSGLVSGDKEVRRLAHILLGKFKGFAFDDFLSYAHAWTLSEIESDTCVDGLKFFDYLSASRREVAGSDTGVD